MSNSADGSTGVLVAGGNTANITIRGAIGVLDDITTETVLDVDGDGDEDGPFARGTDRYGLRVVGAAPLVGDILLDASGSIVVSGNNSYGISLEAPLTGNLTTLGAISVRGGTAPTGCGPPVLSTATFV
jgi:hypothetical protein